MARENLPLKKTRLTRSARAAAARVVRTARGEISDALEEVDIAVRGIRRKALPRALRIDSPTQLGIDIPDATQSHRGARRKLLWASIQSCEPVAQA